MLYTSYISKLKDLPEGIPKVIITRFLPKGLDISKYKNLYIDKSFAPSKDLLLNFKKDGDWGKYVKDFKQEISSRQDLNHSLNELLEFLKNNNDIILICYEKNYKQCHRSLIGEWIQTQGVKWQEYNF